MVTIVFNTLFLCIDYHQKSDNLELILLELLNSRYSERQGRIIDKDGLGSMEKKKQEGYF